MAQSPRVCPSIHKVVGARLPRRNPDYLWDVHISEDNLIESIVPHAESSGGSGVLDAHGRLLAPSLCHAHIHLDKCFLLQDPKYADLEIVKGDFEEAMSLTSEAKRRFEEDDLLRRGRRLIEESIQFGVTHLRAFVELDADVQTKCLDAGLKLKEEFEDRCEVQICAFAQLPCYSGDDEGDAVRALMNEAVKRDGVGAVGSTPYVEDGRDQMLRNTLFTANLALKHGKHLDFHMDYDLKDEYPFTLHALEILSDEIWGVNWEKSGGKHVTMGHCTRLTHLEQKGGWNDLRSAIGSLPVSFVGLPTSDLYMMKSSSGVRGTLNVIDMIKQHRLDAAMSINNVGNAFTPQGSCDPMALASLCVGVYQTGTKQDAELLYVRLMFSHIMLMRFANMKAGMRLSTCKIFCRAPTHFTRPRGG